MKLKRLVEDFQVEEQIALEPAGGPFALYRLTKQSLGTPEAIDAIRRRWNLPREAMAFAGLKDKHALTTQYVTIHHGPKRTLAQTNFELKYVGQCGRPVHASDIVANQFVVVLRDLTAAEVSQATAAIATIGRDGLPNYYDNQRFGSLGNSGEFIARQWCLGDYQRALWLAVADDNAHDGPSERDEKQVLRAHWNDWNKCLELQPGSPWRNILAHLAARPGDFRRAIALVPHGLRSLWLAAFQSHLWNEVLAAVVSEVCKGRSCLTQSIGRQKVPIFVELDDAQRQQLATTLLPLPSARLHLEPGRLKSLYDQVLATAGMEVRQMRVKYPRDAFFSKGERAALFRPGDFSHELDDDELYAARKKLLLRFTLPRGSYATILVKRITGNLIDLAAES